MSGRNKRELSARISNKKMMIAGIMELSRLITVFAPRRGDRPSASSTSLIGFFLLAYEDS
jgi:hypothetical protein